MILKGSQRGGAAQLAKHLLNDDENDHVQVLDLRGFTADTLAGAFDEAQAIAKGTRCQQFLFSLSLNPPAGEDCPLEHLTQAIDRAEKAVGLEGHARAIVIHEKQGRRHAHAVWSRIDAKTMKATNLPFFKTRLNGLAKELYLEHGWVLPEGFRENGWKNPLNFSLAEWQQARRLDLDPRELRQVVQDAWRQSDNAATFSSALEERGLFLARGDRRAFVVLDVVGGVHSLSRVSGVRTKDLAQRLGPPKPYDSIERTRERIDQLLGNRVEERVQEIRSIHAERIDPLRVTRHDLVERQRNEREAMSRGQAERWTQEAGLRARRYRRGLGGVVDLLTGRTRAIRGQNDKDALEAWRRDLEQRERLFGEQKRERQLLQTELGREQAKRREAVEQFVRNQLAMRRWNERAPDGERQRPAAGVDLTFGMTR